MEFRLRMQGGVGRGSVLARATRRNIPEGAILLAFVICNYFDIYPPSPPAVLTPTVWIEFGGVSVSITDMSGSRISHEDSSSGSPAVALASNLSQKVDGQHSSCVAIKFG
jgi:hypothetical protein